MNILITGATKGIGYEIALQFIKRNHKVFGVGRNWENVSNNEIIPIKCDISRKEEREKLFSYFAEKI